MALGKAARHLVLLLVLCYHLDVPEYLPHLFFQELPDADTPPAVARERREALAGGDATEHEVEVGIDVSDVDAALEILQGLDFPLSFNDTGEILSITATTVCSSHPEGGFQCRCLEGFAWPMDTCSADGCSVEDDGGDEGEDLCRCRRRIPGDGRYCQSVASLTVNFDMAFEVRVAASSVARIASALRNVAVPVPIRRSVNLTGANLTTVCDAESCKCEPGFVWPAARCESARCSDVTCDTCTCILERPADLSFCEPMEDVARCMNSTTPTSPTASTTNATALTSNTAASASSPTTSTSNTAASASSPTTSTSNTAASASSPTTSTSNTAASASSPTTSTSNTAPSPPASTGPPQTETVDVTLDREFDESFNELQAPNINRIIGQQARLHIVRLIAVTDATFRSGSTIISFDVTAPVITPESLRALNDGLFSALSNEYPVIYDSTEQIGVQPPVVFFRSNVTLTCGLPPENFTTARIRWRRNGVEIPGEEGDELNLGNILPTDAGEYECLRSNGNDAMFRQKMDILVENDPVIHVSPIRRIVSCSAESVPVECSVDGNHTVSFTQLDTEEFGPTITSDFPVPAECGERDQTLVCALVSNPQFSRTITLTFTRRNIVCDDARFGQAVLNFRAAARCEDDSEGEVTAVCRASTQFEDIRDNCVLAPIQRLLEWSQFVDNMTLAVFLDQLSSTTLDLADEVVQSQATIIAIVRILNNVAGVALTTALNQTLMEDVLTTAGVLTRDDARESWEALSEVTIDPSETTIPGTSSFEARMSEAYSFLETFFVSKIPRVLSVSSLLLQSLETITTRVNNETLDFDTPRILFNKEQPTGAFNIDTDSVEVDIPEPDGFVTAVTFISMENVLPARDELNSSARFVNGRVVLLQSTGAVDRVSFTYDLLNRSLANPQCVFWNFSLFGGLGGWDDEGCELVRSAGDAVTCSCDHLTSFSILMSIGAPDDPALTFITYIGLGISLASLVVCLVIEAVVWRKINNNSTSYLRHVSIVNIAVSLLIANIWLIVAFNVSEPLNVPVCIAATFFVHLFYLALFFWMFASALLLLYRTVSIFDADLSKSSMLAMGFCIGYGAPIVIAAITIAATSPENEYIRRTGGCWLNWVESRALLAFVIPALLIVLVNFVILIIVIYKIWRSRTAGLSSTHSNDKHVIVVIIRSLAILTPLFGLTWALGVGTFFDARNRGIHIAFSFFNSLQGFFILVFGTLLDKKVRSEIVSISTSGTGTRSTSGGNSSGLGIFRRWRQNRDGYHISSSSPPQNASSNT